MLFSKNQIINNDIVVVNDSKLITNSENFTFQQCVNSSPITISIDENFSIGSEISITKENAEVTIISVNCVIRRLGSSDTTNHKIVAQYGVVFLKYVGVGEWRIYGELL